MLGEIAKTSGYLPGFELWKPVGDELIFTTHIQTEADTYQAVRIWLNAMDEYETGVLADVSLATKGGAFVATFPGPDSESSIPRDPTSETSDKGVVELNDEALANRSEDYLFDYFGPSIDTGFRVLSSCSNRYFTLSVEVAWAMAQCSTDAGVANQSFPLTDLTLIETRELKGVWDGREYPIFGIDRHCHDGVNVALAKIHGHILRPFDVVNLCRECSALDNWPSKLYLPQSIHPEFKNAPEDSLAGLRSNSMDGAESVPIGQGGPESLGDNAPLGEGATPSHQSDVATGQQTK